MASIPAFRAWFDRDLSRYGNWADHVDWNPDHESGGPLRICIYTETHRYSITARNPALHYREDEPPTMPAERGSVEPRPADRPQSYDGGYLGCTASTRKPRAGEDWTRGSDLADGPLTEETWHQIIGDILGYELVRIHRRKEPRTDQQGISVPPPP